MEVCWNKTCPHSDTSESGCKKHSCHCVDLCGAFLSFKNTEIINKYREALEKIVALQPGCSDGSYYYEHFSEDGDPVGTEWFDPGDVIARIVEVANEALRDKLVEG